MFSLYVGVREVYEESQFKREKKHPMLLTTIYSFIFGEFL